MHRLRREVRSLPPGPRRPALLQTWWYWGARDKLLQRCRDRYGPSFTVRAIPVGTLVYVSDPEDVKAVFTGDPEIFRAGEANAILRPIMGPRSVLVTDQPAHLSQRKRMLPAFHGGAVERYVEVIRDVAESEMAGWPTDQCFALQPRMQALTLEVILRAVIGVEGDQFETGSKIEELSLGAALRALVTISPAVMLMWIRPELRHVGRWRRYSKVKERADQLLYEEIARRRRSPDLDQRRDVLSVLMRGADGEPGMSDHELRDQLVTLLIAGHETTATGLSWAFERLLRSPEQLARLREQLAAGDDAYLNAVVAETLRVRPVVFDVARVLHAPVRLGGYELPPGVTVVPSIGLVHSREDLYAQAEDFKPERFLNRRPGTYEWMPFGGGIRRCLGAPFALAEMTTVLRAALERFDLRPADPAPERPKMHHITFVPERGCEVIATARAAVAGS